MKKLFVMLTIGSILLSGCNSSQKIETKNTVSEITTVKAVTGNMETVTIPAASLENNVIGELAERKISVYLPPSYEEGKKDYPTLYCLAGYTTSYLDFTYFVQTKDALDKLISGGAINEMIVVTVDGKSLLGGSFYVNSPVTGNWKDFITKDLVNYIDSNYRTIADKNSRGIMGHSMGGYGALNIAMQHPEIFCATYGMSPGLFGENGLDESQMVTNKFSVQSLTSKLEEYSQISQEEAHDKYLEYIGKINRSYSDTLFLFAYGAAFYPKEKAPYTEYFMSEKNEKNEEVYTGYFNGFGGVKSEIEEYRENLLQLKGIKVDYGTRDYYKWIFEGCRHFDEELSKANIPHEVVSYDGDHMNKIRARFKEEVLPYFNEKLTF